MKTAITLAAALLAAAIGLGQLAADDEPQADAPAQADATAEDAAPLSDRPGEEKGIRAMLRAYVEAYNAGKAEDLATLVTEDALLEDSDGAATRGREAIRGQFTDAFADGAQQQLSGTLEALRFFSADVARAEGRFVLTPADDADGQQTGRFRVMAVRRDGAWQIAELQDLPDPDAVPDELTPHDRLKELEWMIGDWVDETEDAKVSSSVRWAEGRSFLVRTFSVEVGGEKASSGTMFLGWDPRSGQLKSWVFDSEGDTGEGYWTRVAPNQWMVKAQGIHHDGQTTSATQLHTVVNKDAVKAASFDRIIGGQPAPDIDEIIMVRKAPAPADLQDADAPPANASGPTR
jgi:uncharacterized protein (TIGR02246 family)